MSDFECRPVTLDDWGSLKELVARARNSKAGGIIHTDPKELELAVIHSIAPNIPFRVQVLLQGKSVVGYAIGVLQQGVTLAGSMSGGGPVHCFIHTVYTAPGTPKEATKALLDSLEDYAKRGGASLVYGTIRAGGPIAAWQRRWGYGPLYTGIGKVLD